VDRSLVPVVRPCTFACFFFDFFDLVVVVVLFVSVPDVLDCVPVDESTDPGGVALAPLPAPPCAHAPAAASDPAATIVPAIFRKVIVFSLCKLLPAGKVGAATIAQIRERRDTGKASPRRSGDDRALPVQPHRANQPPRSLE
jgi:hypothetical protein